MKHSRQHSKPSAPVLDAVMQFVDDEISKIVADINANRPLRPAKPRGHRTKAGHSHARAA